MLDLNEALDLLRRASFNVRIERTLNPHGAEEWWFGTAFFISEDGYALTAYHNFPEPVKQAGHGTLVGFYRGHEIELECLVQRSVQEIHGDLALLKWDGTPEKYVPVGGLDPRLSQERREQYWSGRPSCIFGFPVKTEMPAQEEILLDGSVAAVQPIHRERLFTGPTHVADVEWMRFAFAGGRYRRDLKGISGAAMLDRQTGLAVGLVHGYDLPADRDIIYCTEVARHAARLQIQFAVVGPRPTGYLERFRNDTGWINIRGVTVGNKQVHRFAIGDLYTQLTTLSLGREARADGGQAPAALEHALSKQRVVLVGDPGSGKTTFLNWIVFAACQTLSGEDPAAWEKVLPGTVCLWPVLLRARLLAEHIDYTDRRNQPEPDSPEWLVRYLRAASQKNNWDLDDGFFRDKFDLGCLLLVDGLDEVPGDAARRSLARLLHNTSQNYPRTRIMITSRPPAYTGDVVIEDFETVRIGPLTKEAVEAFVGNWCRCVYPDDPQAAFDHQKDLLGQIEANPAIEKMAVNPLMLTALAALHWNDRRLPDDRRELYESVLSWLAHARKDKPGRLPPKECLRVMAHLALGMQSDPCGRQVEMARYEAAGILAPAFRSLPEEQRREAAEHFLRTEEEDSGIIVGRDDLTRGASTVRFWHLTFQEFLAAVQLGGDPAARKRWLFEENRLYDPEWREVVLLLAATLRQLGDASADEFFGMILDQLEPPGLRGWRARLRGHPTLFERARCAGLIGTALRDLGPGYQLQDHRYRALSKLLAIFDAKEGAAIPFSVRLEAAEALGRAGDPRLEDERQKWICLKGGEFRIGETGKTVRIEAFEIGRYPVTVSEYGKFVKAGGYQEQKYWKAGGFGAESSPEDWRRQERYSNRPVVGVTWYEASAYCTWAGYRLLTEDEWEYAATDGGARVRYPWGNKDPNSTRLNWKNGGLGHPTPVGLYPLGATPSGVQDMAGNVWEWTSSLWKAGSVDRVLRGGSWSCANPDHFLCAFRFCYGPGCQYGIFGFRCARTLK